MLSDDIFLLSWIPFGLFLQLFSSCPKFNLCIPFFYSTLLKFIFVYTVYYFTPYALHRIPVSVYERTLSTITGPLIKISFFFICNVTVKKVEGVSSDADLACIFLAFCDQKDSFFVFVLLNFSFSCFYHLFTDRKGKFHKNVSFCNKIIFFIENNFRLF